MSKAKDYCARVFDGTHESPKPCKKGYRLLTSKNIMNGYLDKTDSYYISNEDYYAINKRSQVRQWDILFSMIGTVGNVCIITDDNIDFAIKNMGVFSCKNEDEAKWLYYYLQSPYIKKVIQHYLNGAVQKFLPLGMLKELDILDYDADKKKIVDLLWKLENKAKNNKKIISKLEQAINTIYDYWLIQYEFPNKDEKPYKSFGGKMEWNNELKKEVPEGWQYKRIIDIENDIITGKTPSTKDETNFGGNIPFITIDDIRKGLYISKTERTLSDKGASLQIKKYIPKNSICVTCIATVGLVGITTKESQTNQQINSIVCKNKYNLYYLVNSIKKYFECSSGAKSGNIFANMNKEDFANIKLIYPTENILERYTKTVKPMYKKIENCILENEKLIKLRDYLLPLLMNGQVDFKD